MKTLPKAMGLFVLLVSGALASGTAMAQSHGHGGGSSRGGAYSHGGVSAHSGGYSHGSGYSRAGGYGYGGGSGHSGGYSRAGGVRFGISLGLPLYGAGYYPTPYYGYPAYAYAPAYAAPGYAYAPAVTGNSAPPVYAEQGAYAEQGYAQQGYPQQGYGQQGYAEQGAPQAQPQAQGDWYYCAASRAYYPDVAECAAGWQRVPAQPPAR